MMFCKLIDIMKRLGVIVLFFLLSLFKLAGCQPDTIDIPVPEDDRLITVNFSAISTSGESLLKSTATPEENLINKIILFGANEPGNIIQVFQDVESGQELIISKNIKSLYTIANLPNNINLQNLLTVNNLMAMTSDFNDAPKSPFLMSGKTDVKANSASVSIEIVRAVARIDVVGKDGFQIEKITVSNIPEKGYVFDGGSLTVPGIKKVTHTYTFSASSDYSVYVPENSSSDPIKLEVTGKLQGKTVSCTVTYLKKDGKAVNIIRNTCYEVGVVPTNSYKDGIKILAIGNSYSRNSLQYMYDLLRQLGVDENKILLVNAYVGGASLQDHATFAKNKTPEYNREVFGTKGGYQSSYNLTLEQLILYQEWDVVTLQQASWASGLPETYNEDLVFLISYVKGLMSSKNPNFKFVWNMTWAYQNGYSGSNQRTMYESICNAVQLKIVNNSAFDYIIPTGTAIQNARGFFGDNLNYDGTHLNNLGCYIAATMWIKTITGFDISKLPVPYTASSTIFCPSYTITSSDFGNIVQAVNNAANSPFKSP